MNQLDYLEKNERKRGSEKWSQDDDDDDDTNLNNRFVDFPLFWTILNCKFISCLRFHKRKGFIITKLTRHLKKNIHSLILI